MNPYRHTYAEVVALILAQDAAVRRMVKHAREHDADVTIRAGWHSATILDQSTE